MFSGEKGYYYLIAAPLWWLYHVTAS